MNTIHAQNLIKDVKKFLGLPPFNDPHNYCHGDGYFYKALCRAYGAAIVDAEIHRMEKTRLSLPQWITNSQQHRASLHNMLLELEGIDFRKAKRLYHDFDKPRLFCECCGQELPE